ncbi:MAG: hypothetical protein ACLPUH_06715 [Steroidobacteraceae bacterium]
MKAQWIGSLIAISAVASSIWVQSAQADNFASVYYDAASDQLVVTMTYRGTNRHHHFSLQWGRCHPSQNGNLNKVTANVLDNQWQEEEDNDFQKTTRFSLADMPCRPAKVTLRTAPHFLATVMVPAAPSQ